MLSGSELAAYKSGFVRGLVTLLFSLPKELHSSLTRLEWATAALTALQEHLLLAMFQFQHLKWTSCWCKAKGTAGVCTHLYSNFAWRWMLAPAAWGFHSFHLALKGIFPCLFCCVGNANQLLEKATEVPGWVVNLLSSWCGFIYTWSSSTELRDFVGD